MLLVPLCMSMAVKAGADPRITAMVVAIAASNTFVLPTHQVNALIMRPGGYRTKDYAKAGIGKTFLFLVVLLSMRSRYPIVRSLLYNDKIIDVPTVEAALERHGNRTHFDRRLDRASLLLAGSFFLSAVLNFVLARVIVKSPAGTVAFNEELGRMTALSYPVIALPSMAVMFLALWYLFHSISRLTHLEFEQIFHPRPR